MTRWFAITPGDAWFFRDARPFNQADPAQMAVPSLYPPNPTTVVGLLRAALARACGWSGRGRWQGQIPDDIARRLGDGDDLGGLRFSGPYVTTADGMPLFPAPTLLFGRQEGEGRNRVWKELVRLTPGPELRCDIAPAPVRLPVFATKPEKMPKPLFGAYFLTQPDMQEVLQGALPVDNPIGRQAIAPAEP